MTTTKMKRCAHCKTLYPYHPSISGPMTVSKYNDDKYCPECAEVIAKALLSVPKKFKKKFVITTDYTREEIIWAQKNRIDMTGIPSRRVSVPLFDLIDGSNEYEHVCEEMEDPVSKVNTVYVASWWSKKPANVTVKKQVWWDILKGKISQ